MDGILGSKVPKKSCDLQKLLGDVWKSSGWFLKKFWVNLEKSWVIFTPSKASILLGINQKSRLIFEKPEVDFWKNQGWFLKNPRWNFEKPEVNF